VELRPANGPAALTGWPRIFYLPTMLIAMLAGAVFRRLGPLVDAITRFGPFVDARVIARNVTALATGRPRRANRIGIKLRSSLPDVGKQKVCLFAAYSPTGEVSERVRYQANRWTAAGYIVIISLASDGDTGIAPDFPNVIVRPNTGYDFGSWVCAIHGVEGVESATILALVNDSMFGPNDHFAAMLARAEESDADVIGAVESHEERWHLQSFLIFFKPKALASPAFWRFWAGVRAFDLRQHVIDAYELPLAQRMRDGGLIVESLFSASAFDLNPTIRDWRGLIERGFPFVKRQVLRDGIGDLTGWRAWLAANGFDVAMIERDLGLPGHSGFTGD
jgi:hypothetical protein